MQIDDFSVEYSLRPPSLTIDGNLSSKVQRPKIYSREFVQIQNRQPVIGAYNLSTSGVLHPFSLMIDSSSVNNPLSPTPVCMKDKLFFNYIEKLKEK